MGKVIQMHTFHFAPDILKFENDNGQAEQHIIIVLRMDNCPYPVISPATSLLKCWAGLKAKSKIEYARRLCEFLNYAYFTRRIQEFSEINTWMVVDFINELGKTHTRSYVQDSVRCIKQCFFYMVYNYPDICGITKEDIQAGNVKDRTKILWASLETGIILPSSTQNLDKMNKLTNLDDGMVFRFLELSRMEAPNCALGFYFMFFGGLRAAEVCQLMDADVPSIFPKKGMFYVNLSDEITNPDAKYADLSQNKRNRKQGIIIIPEIFDLLKSDYKKRRNGKNPVVINKYGKSMTVRGLEERFAKVKNKLIKELEGSNITDNKIKAYQLKSFDWSTHIGRGYYSNLIAKYSKNPYNIAVARGDSGFSSVLPYLAESEETSNAISDILSKVYQKGRNLSEEGS